MEKITKDEENLIKQLIHQIWKWAYFKDERISVETRQKKLITQLKKYDLLKHYNSEWRSNGNK